MDPGAFTEAQAKPAREAAEVHRSRDHPHDADRLAVPVETERRTFRQRKYRLTPPSRVATEASYRTTGLVLLGAHRQPYRRSPGRSPA